MVGHSRSNRSTTQQRLQGKVTRLVLTVITVYIICWLPHWVIQLMLIISPPSHTSSQNTIILVLLITLHAVEYKIILPVLVDLKDSVLHVVVHVVDLVHSLQTVDDFLADPTAFTGDDTLQV